MSALWTRWGRSQCRLSGRAPPMERVVTQPRASSRNSRLEFSLPGVWLAVLAFSALILAFLILSASPVLAAPSWGIEMTHENAYGAQGGVDPYTNSGTTFDRESGYNAYTITVKNTGDETAGYPSVGSTLSCEHGEWQPSPTSHGFQWLRDGAAIPGATASTYQLVTADEGKAVQCEVTAGVEGEDAAVALAPGRLVTPLPSPDPS